MCVAAISPVVFFTFEISFLLVCVFFFFFFFTGPCGSKFVWLCSMAKQQSGLSGGWFLYDMDMGVRRVRRAVQLLQQ